MTDPRGPVPSTEAPLPRGILKNARPRDGRPFENHLHWDESNLQLNEDERDNADPRMVIDEPKTPFVHSANAPPLDDESFQLDGDDSAAETAAVAPSSVADPSLNPDLVAANTRANSGSLLVDEEQDLERTVVTPKQHAPSSSEPEEDEAKHAAFEEKRHRHYGNEAQVLRIAAALATQEEDQEEGD
ncbi:hypothetical protein MSPP1_001017 [Malassezia sp. CBS 17886]|nr:hypothetical protein MSPP1_001017 [Malassezia sp. CBS 17886]